MTDARTADVRTADAPRVLVVEDDASIRRFLRAALQGQRYDVIETADGREGLAQAATRPPDIVLLDLGLPGMDGLEFLKALREWSRAPVIVLTARGQEGEKVRALDAGADDYVTKPFSMMELLARIRVALRHHEAGAAGDRSPVLAFGRLRLDLERRRAALDGNDLALTPTEYRLLRTLAQNAGRVLTHEHLLREVWGPAFTRQRHYLRVYMAQLREKIEEDPGRPRLLLTEPGVGYRMADEA
ncbi:MAG TPA: response regulator [Acidobacteriota bacterium]|nr:response regulator [Acidobacteriota bacterium]